MPAKAGIQLRPQTQMTKRPSVYILASKRNGTLYIGSTDDLYWRTREHKEHSLGGFTAKYDVTRLVWFEEHETRESAFIRERRMKEWNRAWKIRLIERSNPRWRDLFEAMA